MTDFPQNLDTQNPEWQLAHKMVEKTNHCLFITGRAGTGKSTLLQFIRQQVDKTFVVLAPTGIAAVNVKGVTIHSFFEFPLRPMLPNDSGIKKFWKSAEKRKIIEKADTLIIDEISMVRSDMIDAIDHSLRKNGGNPDLPFGGKQLIFVGDLFQLEPVVNSKSGEFNILTELYDSPFFFDAKAFKNTKLLTIELRKVYRQNEKRFIALLDRIRTNQATTQDLQALNKRYADYQAGSSFNITLATTNSIAYQINQAELKRLKTDTFRFAGTVDGEYEKSKLPTPSMLTLKEGAQIMFVKNESGEYRRWVNGTIAKIHRLDKDLIEVKMGNGKIFKVQPETWENVRYKYDENEGKIVSEVIGTYTQFPLILAWSVTIHKSQGLTFDKVNIDLGRGTFASGQLYVALSRCRTFGGLTLHTRINPRDIYVNRRILEFAKRFQTSADIEADLWKIKT